MIEKPLQEVHKVKKEMGGINSKGIHNNFSNEINCRRLLITLNLNIFLIVCRLLSLKLVF